MFFINQHIKGCGKYGIKYKLELEFKSRLPTLCSGAVEFESCFRSSKARCRAASLKVALSL